MNLLEMMLKTLAAWNYSPLEVLYFTTSDGEYQWSWSYFAVLAEDIDPAKESLGFDMIAVLPGGARLQWNDSWSQENQYGWDYIPPVPAEDPHARTPDRLSCPRIWGSITVEGINDLGK